MQQKFQQFLACLPEVIEISSEDLSLIKNIEYEQGWTPETIITVEQILGVLKEYGFYNYLKPFFEDRQQLACQRAKNMSLPAKLQTQSLCLSNELFALGFSPIYKASTELDNELLIRNLRSTIGILRKYQCQEIQKINLIETVLRKILKRNHSELPEKLFKVQQIVGPKKNHYPCLDCKVKAALIAVYSPAPSTEFNRF